MTGDPPLPATPYRPGHSGCRPSDDDPLYAIVAQAERRTVADEWRDNVAYVYGLRLFAHGFFWEAHEAWEPVWAHADPNSRERALLRGLIQLANAHLKAACGRARAATRLALLAAAALDDVGQQPLMGVNPVTLAAALRGGEELDETVSSTILHVREQVRSFETTQSAENDHFRALTLHDSAL